MYTLRRLDIFCSVAFMYHSAVCHLLTC